MMMKIAVVNKVEKKVFYLHFTLEISFMSKRTHTEYLQELLREEKKTSPSYFVYFKKEENTMGLWAIFTFYPPCFPGFNFFNKPYTVCHRRKHILLK